MKTRSPRCDRSFIPSELWQLNGLLGDGLINIKILFSKVSIFSKFWMFQSNLFHSIIVEGKKLLLRKSCVTCITGILLHLSV